MDEGIKKKYDAEMRSLQRWFAFLMIFSVIVLATVIFCVLIVTERAENVSRETITAQTEIEQNAADDQAGRLAGDDIEAAGYAARMYTDADAAALAQMALGECRGVAYLVDGNKTISPEYQQACAMWVALNRYDAGFEDSIAAVVASPKQFHGYAADHPITDELLSLAYDVLDRWQAEKQGAEDVGRVLPDEYLFFVGDTENNYFTIEYGSGVYYAWTLPDVYAEEV